MVKLPSLMKLIIVGYGLAVMILKLHMHVVDTYNY